MGSAFAMMDSVGPALRGGRLEPFLKELMASKTGKAFHAFFFTHRQADPDAICSAYSLSQISAQLASECSLDFHSTIVTPSGASLLAGSVSKKLGIQVQEEASAEEIGEADLIAILDTGGPALLGDLLKLVENSTATKVVVDHHRQNAGDLSSSDPWQGFDLVVLASEATSTCEIVALQFDRKYLTKPICDSLLVGLLFDSQHFGIATESTLWGALVLVQQGARLDEAKALLRSRPERSEIIARLKSAQRLHFKEIAGYIIAETEVSSFQSACARALVEVGADVGIAYGEANGEARVSVRTSQTFFRRTAIDMGSILNSVAKDLGIIGGGHSTAASISGKLPPKKVVEQISERVTNSLPR